MEEMTAHATLAGWEAMPFYDASRGVPLGAFLAQRVLASALTRYRREWRYAVRCVPEGVEAGSVRGPDPRLKLTCEIDESLTHALALLPEFDQSILEQLFWQG
jgi:hypothetical protein